MPSKPDPVADYRHDATRKNNPPAALASQGHVQEIQEQRYHYDPHLPPVLRFDDTGESDRLPELLEEATRRKLTAEEANALADALSNRQPWLEWTGKREKQWFEVDPVALHIHERVSAQAAIRVAARQDVQRGLWADPEQDYHEAVQFYKRDVEWSNRLILGDSLAVMNSLSKREDMAGKVQMIYIDPPYGINYRSNFQPFVRNRNVRDTDADLTREPEVVKAYRDTWTLGVHTYLAYLRDRLGVARDLLTDSGSIFVQIGDENVHRVRAVLDEVFGPGNFLSEIVTKKSGGMGQAQIDNVADFILWYAKDKTSVKYRPLFETKDLSTGAGLRYRTVQEVNGQTRRMTGFEVNNPSQMPLCSRVFLGGPLTSETASSSTTFDFELNGRRVSVRKGGWKTNEVGMNRLIKADRLFNTKSFVNYKLFFDDFRAVGIPNLWQDTMGTAEQNKVFVVQTVQKVIQRCMLMTTDPGDLVLDPTCGSGTTAYVAEQWADAG